MISRKEWEAKREDLNKFMDEKNLKEAEVGAKLTSSLLEKAINNGLDRCPWADGTPFGYSRIVALDILQKQFPDFKLVWYAGKEGGISIE